MSDYDSDYTSGENITASGEIQSPTISSNDVNVDQSIEIPESYIVDSKSTNEHESSPFELTRPKKTILRAKIYNG